MLISKALRDHMVKHFAMSADAADEAVMALVAELVNTKKFTWKEFGDLNNTKDKAAAASELIGKEVDARLAPFGVQLTELATLVKGFATGQQAPPAKGAETQTPPVALDENRLKAFEADMNQKLEERLKAHKPVGNDGASLTAFKILKGGAEAEKDPDYIRVKSAVERFDHTPTAATYHKGFGKDKVDKPIIHNNEAIDLPTPRRKAMGAAWFKSQVCPEMLTEHDKDILRYIISHEKFFIDDMNVKGDVWTPPPAARLLTPREQEEAWNGAMSTNHNKALINDGMSGGQSAIPQFFDTDYVLLPVLGGEMAPLMTIRDAPRGIAASTFSMGVPTFANGTNDSANSITVFNTAALVAPVSVPFYRAAGATEIGLNFLADATPGLADEVQSSYNLKAMEWQDRVIISGNGTTEPTGVLNAAGTITIAATTPTNGPLVIGDAINMLLGIPKAYRQAFGPNGIGFAMTETTYKRFRSIATGVTGDTRLIFGMDLENYQLFNKRAAVFAAGVGPNNDQIVCGQFGGYRWYRRQGLRFRRETQGQTLALKNTMLVIGDMRWGGQPERGSYFTVMQDGPSAD